MKRKILFTQPWPVEYVTEFDKYVKPLFDRGCEIVLDPVKTSLTEKQTIERMPGLYAHVCGADTHTARSLEYADQLKIISRIGVGYDSVDVKACTAKGVAVTITPGASAETVSEFAFALILTMTRNVIRNEKLLRSGAWGRSTGPSLFRKTLGIAGLGHIGKKLAEIVKGFDMKVIAYDPRHDDEFAKAHSITYVNKEELLAQSDYISLHLPMSEANRNFIGEAELKSMKPTAMLVNTSRGGLINELALFNALKDHVIAFAALDVFVKEPIEMGNPLLTLDNFIATAHNAGTSFEGKNAIVRVAVQNVLDIMDGKKPEGLLNPEVFA